MRSLNALKIFITILTVFTSFVVHAESVPTCGKVENATGWYPVGSALAEAGFSGLAIMSLDRSVRESAAKGVSTATYAAIDCLNAIQAMNGLMDLPNYDSSLPLYIEKARGSKANQDIIARFAFRSILQRIGAKQVTSALLPPLKGTSYEDVANGLLAAHRSDWKGAKSALAKVLSAPSDDSLKSAMPAIRLAYARSLYALGEDAAAITEYEKLFRIGLPVQDALIESAWAQLRSKNYMKSIGLSYELTTGKLAQFFAPEASSIRAISFVENCRYSEARKLIDQFVANYSPLTEWLKAKSGSSASLYEMAVARSEGAIGNEAIPEKIWSVWSGSDFFVSTQKGIHQSFEESRKAGEWISENGGTPRTKEIMQADLKNLTAARSRAATRVENHLEGLNRSMASRIAQESERLKMVKIEANQGAGRDLVFRNANPGVVDVEKKLLKAEHKAKSYSGKLAWGPVKADDPAAELWVDEIGGFEASALDRCKVNSVYKGSVAGIHGS